MTRVKNSSFAGASVYDGDVDAPTFTRVLKNVQADAALVYDKLTGLNGETVLIDHNGDPGNGDLQGAPMGIPLVNQYIGVPLYYESATATGGGKGGGPAGSTGHTYLIAVPFFQPSSEITRTLRVEVDVSADIRGNAGRVVVIDTSGTTIYNAPLEYRGSDGRVITDGQQGGTLTASVLPGTGMKFLFVEVDTDRRPRFDIELFSWRMHPGRIRTDGGTTLHRNTTNNIGVTTPAATEMLAWRDYDSSLFTDYMAGSAYLAAGINRNLNGLWEFLTGWPAGGDAAYEHVDHNGAGAADDVNPARSRFHAGTRSLAGYPDEPMPDFPVHCEALGATLTDGYPVVDAFSSGTQHGLVGWQPVTPSAAAKTAVHRAYVAYPDFPDGASSNLKWVMLASFATGTPGQWTGYCSTVTAEGSSTFTAITGTAFAYASGTALDFPPDENGTVTLSMEKTTGGAHSGAVDEVSLLGWCLYFDP